MKKSVFFTVLCIFLELCLRLSLSYASPDENGNSRETIETPIQEQIHQRSSEATAEPVDISLPNVGPESLADDNNQNETLSVLQREEQIEELPKTELLHREFKIIMPPTVSDVDDNQIDKSECPSGYQGLWANPKDCTKFINCAGQTKGIRCPNGVLGRFPYPFSRRKYIECSANESLVETCPTDRYFSLMKYSCELWSDKQPDEIVPFYCRIGCETNRLVSCHPDINGSHLYPYDASKYIQCEFQMFKIRSCPPDHVFSLQKSGCFLRGDIPSHDRVRLKEELAMQEAVPPLSSAPTSNIECPWDVRGVFPHPFDNGQYIKCFEGQQWIKHCRQGYSFSLSQRICEKTELLLEALDTAIPRRISALPNETDSESTNGEGEVLNSTDLKCPPDINDKFIFPFLKQNYIKCTNGLMEIESCSNGQVYSINDQMCKSCDETSFNNEESVKNVGSSYTNFIELQDD